MAGFAKKAAGALGIAFSAQSVISFGKHVFDTASDIKDMSDKLGISTTAVQGFKYAAEQTGSSMDAVGQAITRMNKGLVEGDKSTVKALKEIGLDFGAIRAMRPEDAFETIADAIARVPDPMVRSHAALEIFGKSAAELLPAMREGIGGLADAADKMSEDTIRSLESAQDAWNKLGTRVTIITGNMIGTLMNAATRTTRTWSDFLMFADNAIKFGAGAAVAMADAQEKATTATSRSRDVHLATEPVIKKTGETHAEVTKVLKAQVIVTAEETHALALLAEATKRANAEARYQEEIGRKNLEGLGNYAKALPTAIFQTQSFAGAVAMVSAEAATFQGNLANVRKDVSLAEKMFGSAADFGKSLANTIMGAIQGGGNPIAAAAGMVGQQITTHLAKTLTDAGSKLFNTAFGGMINAILPGLGSLLGPLVSGIAKVFDRNKGRDIVEDFAKGFGGFEALHKELGALGAAGEQLWIKLTQGVGRNNKDQARMAVEEVTAALEKHKTAQDAVKTAAEAATTAEIIGFEKASEALKTLDGQIKSLEDSIAGEAPEEFMGIIEMQTRARIEGLKKEREAAQDALTKLTETMTQSIDGVKQAIDNLPKVIQFGVSYGPGPREGEESPSSSLIAAGSRSNAVRFVSTPSAGGSNADLVEQLAAQNAALLVQLPKAITAAMQKAAA